MSGIGESCLSILGAGNPYQGTSASPLLAAVELNLVLTAASEPEADGLLPRHQVNIEFRRGDLTPSERSVVTEGFQVHSEERDAPEYRKERLSWLAFDEHKEIRAVLTTEILWDWIYIDELWVSAKSRGEGLGVQMMRLAEEFAISQGLQGIWLWTQSWQAEGFYRQLGYHEFTRFENFPKGHARIGFRKQLP